MGEGQSPHWPLFVSRILDFFWTPKIGFFWTFGQKNSVFLDKHQLVKINIMKTLKLYLFLLFSIQIAPIHCRKDNLALFSLTLFSLSSFFSPQHDCAWFYPGPVPFRPSSKSETNQFIIINSCGLPHWTWFSWNLRIITRGNLRSIHINKQTILFLPTKSVQNFWTFSGRFCHLSRIRDKSRNSGRGGDSAYHNPFWEN